MVKEPAEKQIKPSFSRRPPVVCVLGHVDHGKTTLLDYIRKTKVALKESGNITQHIGAYQVKIQNPKLKIQNYITFIDTPGHAAFAKIRCRGAQVADLAILVIDATEGVKPQTQESLTLIQEAKIPFIIALNKIDLPEASVEKVKNQLAKMGVLVEGYGGQIVAVPISAKTGEGVDELLEIIILQSELQELKAQLDGPAQAVVIEAKLDPRRGPLASVIVQKGIIYLGNFIHLEQKNWGKVKAMFDEKGSLVKKAEPAKPVEILGFKEVPPVGSLVDFSSLPLTEEKKVLNLTKPVSFKEKEEEEKKLKLILKTDVFGSLEAIKASLPSTINLIEANIGEINESDVLLASSSKAIILGFRVGLSKSVKKLAEFEKVKIKTYQVIYQLLEDLEKEILALNASLKQEEILGEAKIIAEFKIKKVHIAGCRIVSGRFQIGDKVKIKNQEKIKGLSRIKNMQKNRQEIKTAEKGDEVGMVFSDEVDFALEDDIIAYQEFNPGD